MIRPNDLDRLRDEFDLRDEPPRRDYLPLFALLGWAAALAGVVLACQFIF